MVTDVYMCQKAANLHLPNIARVSPVMMSIVPRVMALHACHRQSLLTWPRDWKLVVAACGRLFLKKYEISKPSTMAQHPVIIKRR